MDTVNALVDLSLNFFFILPFLNSGMLIILGYRSANIHHFFSTFFVSNTHAKKGKKKKKKNKKTKRRKDKKKLDMILS